MGIFHALIYLLDSTFAWHRVDGTNNEGVSMFSGNLEGRSSEHRSIDNTTTVSTLLMYKM